MITESDKEKQELSRIKNGIRLCEETIAKSEKYERLQDNPDWKSFLGDMKVLADLHEKEIQTGTMLLIDAPNDGHAGSEGTYISSKQDWVDFIIRHQIQRQECLKWIEEPDRILAAARMAREKLPLLKEKLDRMNHASD